IGQLHLFALFEQFFLQLIVDQRNRNGEIADLEFRRLKRRVAIFGSQVSLEGDPYVFSCDAGEELALDEVSLKVHLLVLDAGFAGTEISGERAVRTARRSCEL